MSPIRKAINFAIALALTLAGVSSFIFLVFFANGWRGWMLMASAAVGFGGAYWLWADFMGGEPNEDK